VIVVDASILIAHLDGNDARHDRATRFSAIATFDHRLAKVAAERGMTVRP
jgi:predicted nucleic acid-binding protein